MKQLSIFVPETYIDVLDYLIENDHFPNRSEAVRSAIRMLIGFEMDLKDKLINGGIKKSINEIEKLDEK